MARPDAAAGLDRLLALTVLLHEDMIRGLAARGLTEARAHLLWEVHHRGPVTQRELADALRVSPRNVTGLVDALEESGFVARTPHPQDRRATLVALTELGRATATRLREERDTLAEMLFAPMPEEQLACFVQGMDAVLTSLHSALEDES